MCMWQPVGMFSVGQHHSRSKWPGLFPLPDSQQPGLLASILRALSLSSLPQNTQRPLGRSQNVNAILGSPNIGFWNLQNLEPPNIPEKFDYHDLSNQNGKFFGGTLQKFDGIQLAKRCLKRCCTMYRAKMCQPTYHTFRPLEYDGTYSTITCVVIGCFWLLTYQNHVSRQWALSRLTSDIFWIKAMTGNRRDYRNKLWRTSLVPYHGHLKKIFQQKGSWDVPLKIIFDIFDITSRLILVMLWFCLWLTYVNFNQNLPTRPRKPSLLASKSQRVPWRPGRRRGRCWRRYHPRYLDVQDVDHWMIGNHRADI